MSKSRMMEFAENLQTMQNQRKELLTNFNKNNLAIMKKSRTFASDMIDEPTALATDVGKSIPILTGDTARYFLERMEKAEECRKEQPTLESLKRLLSINKVFLETEEAQIEERKKRIKELETKIKELDGKS